MSRIHDALKKAEEQRQSEGNLTPEIVESPSAVEAAPDVAPIIEQEPMPVRPAAPPPVSDPALDTLVQRCVKTTWTPTKSALFLHSDSPIARGQEEFRTLRAKLFQARAKKPLRTVLVTSAVPGEGKSFVSANLAQVFAKQRGGRTLLIDADLRKPQLHELLGAPSGPGLSEYLGGKANEFEIVQKSNYEDLFFIPGGQPTNGTAELIGNGKLRHLLERLGPLFNWIVFDSSPAIPVSDPTRLAEYCDGVLLVVRAASTSYLLADKAKREFHERPVLGVVLNQVESNDDSYSAYYYKDYSHYKA